MGEEILNEIQLEKLKRDYQLGMSVSKLSKKYGVSSPTVRRKLQKMNVYRPTNIIKREKEIESGITKAEISLLGWQLKAGSRVPMHKRIISYDCDKFVYGFVEVISVHGNVVRTTGGDTTLVDIILASREMRKGQRNE